MAKVIQYHKSLPCSILCCSVLYCYF